MRAANLLVRFLLELSALGALGYWGSTTATRLHRRVLLATTAVLAAAVAWMLVVAPNAGIDAGPVVRWAVELTVFGAAALGLARAGRPRLSVVLLVLYAVNRVLMEVWDQ